MASWTKAGIRTGSFTLTVLCGALLGACGGGSSDSAPTSTGSSSPGGWGTPSSSDFVYVSNTLLNTFYVMKVSDTDGSLSQISGSPFPLNPPAYNLALSPDDRFAFYASPETNCIATFSVTGSSGTLSPIESCVSNVGSTSVTIDPSGRYLFTPDGDEDTVSVFAIGANGNLIQVPGSPFATGKQSWHVAISPNGSFAYVTNQEDNTVSGFSIDPSTGVLTPVPGSPFKVSGFVPQEAAIEPTGRYLYVTDNSPGLECFIIDSETGSLSWQHLSTTSASGQSIAINAAGKYLYVVNGFDMEGFTIDSATGQVTHMPPIVYPDNSRATKVIVDRSGKYVYYLDNALQAVWAFSVDAATGYPTLMGNSPYILSTDSAGSIGPVGFTSSH